MAFLRSSRAALLEHMLGSVYAAKYYEIDDLVDDPRYEDKVKELYMDLQNLQAEMGDDLQLENFI
jgi:hypothetical protein